jgi:serine/threonine protein phosphatase PrpC
MKLNSPFDHLVLFAIADGHGGSQCSEYVADTLPKTLNTLLAAKFKRGVSRPRLDTLLRNAVDNVVDEWDTRCLGKPLIKTGIVDAVTRTTFFSQVDVDEYEKSGKTSGSTLVAVLIDKVTRRVVFANIGDSRATMKILNEPIVATIDQSVPKNLTPHMNQLCAKFEGVYLDGRVNGDLGMASAIGDLTPELTGMVSRKADVFTRVIPPDRTARIYIGSDGLWDEVSAQSAYVNSISDATSLLAHACGGDESQFHDNTTVIVVNVPKAN